MADHAMTRGARIPQVVTPDVADGATARAVNALGDAVRRMQARALPVVVTADLVVGRNAVTHALGRPYAFASVMLTVAGGAFDIVADNPHPDRQVLIDVTGVDQPGAAVLVI